MDGNQELAGIGSANLAAGLFSGFPVSTSGSRTAVAAQSGAKTQLTGLVAAALVLAMLLVVPGLVQAMPQPVLAAVIIAASISLFDVAELRRLYQRAQDRVRAARSRAASAWRSSASSRASSSPSSCRWSTSSSAPGRRTRRSWERHRTSPATTTSGATRMREQVPGLLIIRWSAPLFFANANQFRDRIRELVKAADPPPQWVLVAAEPITDIDTTAGRDAGRPRSRAQRGRDPPRVRGAPVRCPRHDRRYGLFETIEEAHFYRSVTEAADALRSDMDPRS